MDKAKGIKVAEEYCKKNGISLSRLKGTYIQIINEKLYFLRPENNNGDGLKNDMESKCIPVLVVDNNYVVEVGSL